MEPATQRFCINCPAPGKIKDNSKIRMLGGFLDGLFFMSKK